MDAESAKEMTDVVSDGFGAQVELMGDLLGRVSPLEEAKHLGLTGSQCRVLRSGLVLDGAGQ